MGHAVSRLYSRNQAASTSASSTVGAQTAAVHATLCARESWTAPPSPLAYPVDGDDAATVPATYPDDDDGDPVAYHEVDDDDVPPTSFRRVSSSKEPLLPHPRLDLARSLDALLGRTYAVVPSGLVSGVPSDEHVRHFTTLAFFQALAASSLGCFSMSQSDSSEPLASIRDATFCKAP